ncbi:MULTISPECIES: YheV family putative zinc ribbon protein [unclassified Acinetobacter]|uniref:YheV family putative zinc ribbon protein n=1 Tax=unclassified Acinetobacter TaxID=196816 RepID=UPI0035B93D2C
MTKKRFIAGAKCPRCGAVDCIVMFTSQDAEWVECIHCDYQEHRPTAEDLSQNTDHADDVGVVRFKPR